MNWLGELIQKEVSESDNILDLGCGIMQGTDGLKVKSITGVDVWEKYLDRIKHKYNVIKLDMGETDRFLDKSYDVVICLDVVEHLEKELALKVIDECKRICRKKAIIYTPIEFDDNSEAVDNSWGLGENEHQRHLSLIERVDFISRGYNVKNPINEGYYCIYEVK